MKFKAPATKKIIINETIHGVKVSDPYRWLEEEGKETTTWIKKQNSYTETLINEIPVRRKLKQQLKKLYKIDSIGIPVIYNNRYFFMERKGSEDLSVLYVQDGLKNKPRVLIDQNKLSKDKTAVIKGWSPSWDGKLLAYSLSDASNDKASIYIMDVETGKKLLDVIPGDLYPSWGVTWKPDNSGFWYNHRHPKAPKGAEKFHQKLYFHNLGSDFKDDPLIYGEDLAKEDTPEAQISKDGRYLLITTYFSSTEKEKTEIYFKDLNDLKSDFMSLVKGIDSLFYGSIYKDTIFVMTNHKAPDWKIVSFNVKDIKKGIKAWKTVIPEDREAVIDNYKIINNHLFVSALEDARSLLKIYDLEGKFIKELPLPTIGSIGALTGEEDGDELFFYFSSYLIPGIIYRYDLKSKQVTEFKRVKMDINDKLFTVKQVWYTSKDGTKVPMFIIHKKDINLNGDNPTMLYGYGGFNISTTPGFDRTLIPFLENGGVYVDAILRGGGEFGEEWHKAGIKNKKQNVFDDFIVAAEWLIKNKYTNPNRLAIFGWSNGGLLVGAAITQRPELFKAALIGAPVIDMIRYHHFHGARHWIQEYGSAENKSEFKYLLKYSPYHNIKIGEKYPSVLILTADKDDRVHPMHAFKMAAKLQHDSGSNNPVLIRIEVQAGHSGAAPVYKSIDQYSDMWSFIYWQLGII
jgi:prolyl oligopeptidase